MFVCLLDDIPFVMRKCVTCQLRGCSETKLVHVLDVSDEHDRVRICLNCGARAVPNHDGGWVHYPPDNPLLAKSGRDMFDNGFRWLSPVRLIWEWTRPRNA